jgi:hypothetical protein
MRERKRDEPPPPDLDPDADEDIGRFPARRRVPTPAR